MLAIGAGAVATVAFAWLALTLLAGSGGGASNVTLALETDGGPGDLYLIDQVEDAGDTARDDRVLRDVRVAGLVRVVDGDRVLSYDPFGYNHDGDALFAYQEDGDDEWIVAVLDGREVVEIEQVDSFPNVLVTSSGAYLIERGSDSCSILRLSGHSAERVARADFCTLNGAADVAVLAELVRDLPALAAAGALDFYDYRLADSLTLALPSREIRVYKVEVRPQHPEGVGVVGAMYLDRGTADIVRMELTFTAASYLDETLDFFGCHAVTLSEDGHHDGRNIGERIGGEAPVLVDPEDAYGQERHHDQQTVIQKMV